MGEFETLGIITFDPLTETCSYTVVPLTDEEINDQILSDAQEQNEVLVFRFAETSAQDEAQNLPDDDAKHVSNIYPFWITDFAYTIGFKAQYLDNKELKLYRCVQAHTSQPTFTPPATPALWTRIPLDGQILPWKQPTGAQDAYAIGDQVTYQGNFWESTVDANVYAPGVVPGQWVQFTP